MSVARDREIEATTPAGGGGRRVLLLVSGGIAAYKACLVLRRLVDLGFEVRVAMTEAATRFVTPMTFEALSGRPVGTSLWGEGGEEPLDHVQWARQADLILVAPATANTLAKLAHGLADDLPSTLLAAGSNKPIVVAPAMNDQMWHNPANRANLATLRSRGVDIVEPGSGFLACGVVAEGRLAEAEEIVAAVLAHFEQGVLRGRRVLITGGGTREAIDAVRFVGNRSSGRMGIALAEAARSLGGTTTLLLGPSELPLPDGVTTQRFESAADLERMLPLHAGAAEIVVMAAAVADYRPVAPSSSKQKKGSGLPQLQLEATPDLLAALGAAKRAGQVLVGFALETGSDEIVERECAAKLSQKQLDLICGNRADVAGEGFQGERNRIYLRDRQGGHWLPEANKQTLARQILERAALLLGAAARERA
jgi:phosphopantothenoylcysteine decarboxylase/phosphopantothenate--cysteine ligase